MITDVLEYEFPAVTKVDLAFPTMGAPPELVALARQRRGETPGHRLFSAWFYAGLKKAPNFKKEVDQAKAQRAMNWVICFMRSWEPKHEDKKAVCALIFDAALDLSNIDDLRR